ncbi:MAG: phosphodiester glycosidase family protein [Anaerolineae bacterium]|nr:MAG: phosphodiester glycosidase family protein [Anaerolineae bacterium]
MTMSLRNRKNIFIFIAVLTGTLLSGCKYISKNDQELVSTPRTDEPLATTNPPVPVEIIPDTGWTILKPGFENRILNLVSEDGVLQETVYIVRIDPNNFRFEVGYQPADPLPLQGWLEQSGADLVVNGGFFTEENKATGLVIADGESFGASYQGFGGMLAIDQAGPTLRSLVVEPYNVEEHLIGAVQSFPMLLLPGNQGGYTEAGDGARRSVIARDSQGRFIFLVAGYGLFTLSDLSQYLADSDLGLESALNLDGGASAGLLLSDSKEGIPSFSLLPTVILVFQK